MTQEQLSQLTLAAVDLPSTSGLALKSVYRI